MTALGTTPGTGEYIYVSQGSGSTTGNYAFKANQKLNGAGVTFMLGPLTITGATVNAPTLSGTLSASSVTGLTVNGIKMSTSGIPAVNFVNSDGTFTFFSISTSGGTNGIIWSNVSATGGFTVTGDGASDPNNTTRGNTTAKAGGGTITLGSGGTIQNTTGSGILLTNTGAVSLTGMNILNAGGASVNTGNEGIRATNVNGLTLDNIKFNGGTGNSGLRGYSSASAPSITNLSMQHVDIDGNGTVVGTETNDNWNVRIDDLAGNCGDATNGCHWNNSLFFNSRENVVGLKQGINKTNVNTTMTITNCEFRDTTTFASPANDAFGISAFNSAVTNVTATGSTFKNIEVTGFQYAGNDSSSGIMNVRNSVFENTGTDINIAHQGGNAPGATTLTFDISGNTERQTAGNSQATVAMNIFLAGNSNANSQMTGTIKNNTIGNAAVNFSGSHVGDGIDVNATGAGTITATVTGNTVHQIKSGDAFFGEGNSGSGKLNLFIHNNSFNVDNNGTATAALHLVGGAVGTDTTITCADVAANTLHGATSYGSVELDALGTGTSGIKLIGYSGATDDSTAIATFFNTANTSVTPAANAGFMVHSGGHIQSATTCGVTFP